MSSGEDAPERSPAAPVESAGAVAEGSGGGPAALPTAGGSSHRRAFALVYALLGVVGAAAIAALAVLLLRDDGTSTQAASAPWSEFQPGASGLTGAQEIADFIESRYVFPDDGQPIVEISASELTLQELPVQVVVVRRPDPSTGRIDQLVVQPGMTIKYGLCGTGARCAIDRGTPSPERLLLLERESVELALYTFHYLPEVDSVVAFVPPRQDREPEFALFFRRGDLVDELERPLVETLPATVPASPEAIPMEEQSLIETLAGPFLFRYGLAQFQEDAAALVLAHPDLPFDPADPFAGILDEGSASGTEGTAPVPAAPPADGE